MTKQAPCQHTAKRSQPASTYETPKSSQAEMNTAFGLSLKANENCRLEWA